MKKFVGQLINKKKNRYKEDYDEMLGDYYREIETIKGYNGRQLLELLQNCDDEGSKEVLIKIDKPNQTISISNNGTPFSKKGYRSLFIANLSSKTSKRKYIGNKGLGFRSIINWSNAIEIQSNNLSLKYSQKIRKNAFDKLFSKDIQLQITNEEGLKKGVTPMPFLTMPEISQITQEKFITSIIIEYKIEFYKDILKQIEAITPETLLFLKNLESIKFEGFEENRLDIVTKKQKIQIKENEFGPSEKVKNNGNTWYVFEEEELLKLSTKSDKKEKEFYQIKIAIEENFDTSVTNLYSFFPTNINLTQPYILHASFDLDATRNQLVDSVKNKIILEKVVQFTCKVANFYALDIVSYKPLEILNHNHRADTLNKLGYYELVEKAILTEAIFPCIDNNYRTLEEVIYVNDDFAEMLINIGATKNISIHIIPFKDKSLESFSFYESIVRSIKIIKDVIQVINGIAEKDLTIKQRAVFIYEIVNNCSFIKSEFKNEINFLINNNSDIIDGNEYIYTPVTKENELETPYFTKIQFINDNLYDELLEVFAFETDENSNKGRFIYDQLTGFCNIHSYEPATLARKIISETNTKVEEKPLNKIAYVKEMNRCLFHNYAQFEESTKLADNLSIPSITKEGKIVSINKLVLSKYYPQGEKTEIIFDEVYSDDNYITSPDKLGVEVSNEGDIFVIEQYLKWLGINTYVKYVRKEVIDYGIEEYVNFVYDYDYYGNRTGYKIIYTEIENFKEILSKISLENLILWVYLDPKLKAQLSNENNTDQFNYFYRNYHTIYTKPSYIKHLIETNYDVKFNNILIDEKYNWVNDVSINYRGSLFVENGLKKSNINEILVTLGAKDNFDDLSIDIVADIINKLPLKYPNGKNSLTFYKKALSHYKVNEQIIENPIQLFANDGDSLNLYNQEEVYFSEKIKLPKKLKKEYPIFNYPSRAGGAGAIKFFGINNLKDINITLGKNSIISSMSNILNEHLQSLKPFLLTLRINGIEELKLQQNQASICNKIKIYLCSKLEYSVNEETYETSLYEYLHSEAFTYYIKINPSDTLEELLKNGDFTESIADVISLSFDVFSDKNEFRHIVRSNIEMVKNDIINDYGEDSIKVAQELLGLADYKQAFWKTIFDLKNEAYEDELDDLALQQLINQKLNYNFSISSIEYELIDSKDNTEILEQLFKDLSISLKEFVKSYPYNLSYYDQHYKNIRNRIQGNKLELKSALWKKMEIQSVSFQKEFLVEIKKFENYEDFALEIAEDNKYSFRIDLENALHTFIKLNYGDLELNEIIEFEELLKKNKEPFTSEELEFINEDIELKSLLYFESAQEKIKKRVFVSMGQEVHKEESEKELVFDGLEMVSSEKLKDKTKNEPSNKIQKPYIPKGRNNKKLKKIGDVSEAIVKQYLKDNNYQKVYKVSDDDEGMHYDIRYVDEMGNIKYVEVKSFDNKMFHLSKYEYEFGLLNQEDFEIWLVQDKKKIIPIKDFYTNQKYNPIITEYEVYLELE